MFQGVRGLLICTLAETGREMAMRYPFAEAPPIGIRAMSYSYDFTRINSTWVHR